MNRGGSGIYISSCMVRYAVSTQSHTPPPFPPFFQKKGRGVGGREQKPGRSRSEREEEVLCCERANEVCGGGLARLGVDVCMYVCTGQRGDAPGSVCMLRNSAYSLFLSLPLSVCVCMYVSLNPNESVRIPFPALCAFCFYCVFIN